MQEASVLADPQAMFARFLSKPALTVSKYVQQEVLSFPYA